MRKLILLLTAALLVLCTGCSQSSEAVNIVPEDAAKEIIEKVEFQNELWPADAELATGYYHFDDKVESFCVYVDGSGAKAEEVAVILSSDPKTAKAAAEKRVQNLKETFENYVPQEMVKLKNPVIVTKGNAVILIIADDHEAAKKVADEILK